LWKRAATAELLSFGPVSVQAPGMDDALYIVDGQQRITALVGALLHPDERPLGGAHAIWVDLQTGTFEAPRRAPGAGYLPLNVLGDRKALLRWASASELGEHRDILTERAFELEEKIIRYAMPAYVVETADHRALRLIFSRVNSAGAPLKEDQVFQALFGEATAPAGPLDRMAIELDDETGFGRLDTGWLLRCVKAVAGLDAKRSFSEHEPALPSQLADTHDALRHAILFLQQEARFPHSNLLPYRFPLIVLARLFHVHPSLHPRNRQLMVRWVWRGALGGEHSDSSQGTVQAHLGDIGEDEHESVQRLLRRVPPSYGIPTPQEKWNGRSAVSRLFAAAMLQRGPRNPETDDAWTDEALLELLSREDIGKVFRPVVPGQDAIAARALLPRGFDPESLKDVSDEILASLAIHRDAAAALRRGDASTFVEFRIAALESLLSEVVARIMPADNDRPPMEAIRAHG
jgi:hypothetical protein